MLGRCPWMMLGWELQGPESTLVEGGLQPSCPITSLPLGHLGSLSVIKVPPRPRTRWLQWLLV